MVDINDLEYFFVLATENKEMANLIVEVDKTVMDSFIIMDKVDYTSNQQEEDENQENQ